MAGNEEKSAIEATVRALYSEILDLPFLDLTASNATISPAAISSESPLPAAIEQARFCQRCVLHTGRRKSVFARGPLNARIAFVGDFPSAADNEKGEPFADEAGALLHKMIVAMKVAPEAAYLTNLFKCRPPVGLTIEATHVDACIPYLHTQAAALQSPVIVAMGEIAARALARSEAPLRVLRGQEFQWNGKRVFCTHHPRELLTAPAKKKEAWTDLQSVMLALT